MSDNITTRAIVTALVNALMETRGAGATDEQILEAATSTLFSVAVNLQAEELMIAFLPQMQMAIYAEWQKRMANEGVGVVRH